METEEIFLDESKEIIDAESRDEDTVVMAFNGAKGSGKSLLLARQGIYDMCVLGRTVWSNMSIHTGKYLLKRGYPKCESKPLDVDLIYMLDEGIQDGTIILDEVQNLSDSRTALSLKNRLLNGMMYQIRKRNLRVFYSVKQNAWIDKRLQYETDIRVDCTNLAKTPWGREKNIKGGRLIRLELFDLSGTITGHPLDKYSRPYQVNIFKGGRYFYDCFDSWATVDLDEIYAGVKLDMKQRIITNKPQEDDIQTALVELAGQFRESGELEVNCDRYRAALAQMHNIDVDSRVLGRYTKDIFPKKRRHSGEYFYDFTALGA